MTTEVAILNRAAVALAADSAVTVHNEKTYNSANKLFTLSKYEPVGIMVYGSGSIMSLPWETVIKAYRKKLGETAFDTIQEYGEHFIDFLTKDRLLFSDKARSEFLHNTCSRLFEQIRNEVLKAAEEADLNAENEAELFGFLTVKAENLIDQNYIHFESELPHQVTAEQIDTFVENNREVIEERAESILEMLFINLINPEAKARLIRGIGVYLFSDHNLGSVSGIVISGFGDQELFPKAICMELEGVFDGGAKYRIVENKSSYQPDDKFTSSIIPFAQSDMIFTYLQGIAQPMEGFILNRVAQMSIDLAKVFGQALEGEEGQDNQELTNNLVETARQKYQELINELNHYKEAEHTSRVLEMVDILPKDELAEMAETLVNLIAFKRKITRDLETVGGPIDVAIITKGDGFVWIKRKHYFKKELNPQFFNNYNRS